MKRERRQGHATGDWRLRKKLALEIIISGVVVFDILGSRASNLPIWQFFPMWVGAMLEIEVGARLLGWFSKRLHIAERLQRLSKRPAVLDKAA